MKIAVAGKGGVGKTTISGSLVRELAQKEPWFAIDADPNSNLATSVGFTLDEAAEMTPLIEMRSLIEERTGAAPGTSVGAMFKMNPDVSDVPELYGKKFQNITFLLTGAMREPLSGCYCPENAFLKNLLMSLFMHRDEGVMLDMEAGFEHLTRGTLASIDNLLIVIEPGMRSVVAAERIEKLARDLGIENIMYTANKIKEPGDLDFIKEQLSEREFAGRLAGQISYSEEVLTADRAGKAPYDLGGKFREEIGALAKAL